MCCHEENHVCERSCIRQVPVFQSLNEQELGLLQTVTVSHHYDKGAFVFREGEQSESLFVLSEGVLKLTRVSDGGKEHILRFLFPGDFFGQFALLQQEKRHYANAEAIEPAVVCRIHRDDFLPLIEKNPAMTYRFLMAMSERLQQADEWAGAIHLLEAERRLAKMLLHFQQKSRSGSHVRLPAAKKELAAWIGTTPETLSRKLSRFEADQVIRVEKRTIRILDPAVLQQLAGEA